MSARSARYNSVYSTAANEIRESGLWEQSRGSLSDDYVAPGYPQAHQRQQSGLRNELSREYAEDDIEEQEKFTGNRAYEREATEDRFEPPVLSRGAYEDHGGHAYEYEQARYDHRYQQQPYDYATSYQPHQQQQQGTWSQNAQGWDPAYHR